MAQQVRELERLAVRAGIAEYAMMQRAAAAAWRELTRAWPRSRALAVVCGPGNNGGDGFELARLAHVAGWNVNVLETGTGAKGAALRARKALTGAGGKVRKFKTADLGGADVIVDAIFGTGLSRAPDGVGHDAIEAINAARARGAGVLAVDIPSGLDANLGSAPGAVVTADLTVSFIARKPGLHTGIGPDRAGRVVLDGLDLPPALYRKAPAAMDDLGADLLRQLLPRRKRTAHKGDHGHVLVVGGDRGMGGAALLAARAALRAGAGWVSVATHPAHAAAMMAAQPELMVHGVENGRALRALFERATTVAVGPGLGRDDWGRQMWSHLRFNQRPTVIDADGLNWLADEPDHNDDWILTPHPGEAGRLLDVPTVTVQQDRPAAVAVLAQKFGGVAVLKGAGTLVQGARLGLCAHGSPALAVGGTGDVLCGLIAGLLAQGLSAEDAARAGVVAHALAGERTAWFGERGAIPSDLLAEFQSVLNPPF